jgi:FkbM family methyltransferase
MLKRTIISVLHRLLKNYIYLVRHGIARGLKRRGGLGFIPFIPQTPEEEFLLNLDLSNQIIYDIGGYKGLYTIFFARAVGKKGRVITFEPHPENCSEILENVRLNELENVEVRRIALGKNKGEATLAFRHSEFATASLKGDIQAHILQEKGAKTIKVEIDTLDGQITTENLPRPDLIKIDVEGLEMDVLLGMKEMIRDYKPKLFLEIHGISIQSKIENALRVVKFLIANEYSIYHIESKETITSSNAQIAKEGHLYCT